MSAANVGNCSAIVEGIVSVNPPAEWRLGLTLKSLQDTFRDS